MFEHQHIEVECHRLDLGVVHEGFDAGMQGGLHWAKVQSVRWVVGCELAYSRETCTADMTLCCKITCMFRKLPMGQDGLHVGAWMLPSHGS
jgi:hypothetical protein